MSDPDALRTAPNSGMPTARQPRSALTHTWWQAATSQRPSLAEALTRRDIGVVFQFLRSCGWSVTALAAATVISENQVRSIARGEQQVRTYDVLERIAEGLSIPRGLLGLAYVDETAETARR